jgi:hypothetical protein
MMWLFVGLLAALTAIVQGPKNAAQIEFVKIAPGEFVMGCAEGDHDCLEDEVPRHRVRLTRGFELGKYEVTQAQWAAVMGANSNPSDTKGPNNPVDSVNKDEIHARIIHWALELPPPNVLVRNGFNTDVYRAMMVSHEEITVTAFQAKDGSKHAWAAGLTRSDGKTVITLGGLPAQPYSAKPNGDRKVKQ